MQGCEAGNNVGVRRQLSDDGEQLFFAGNRAGRLAQGLGQHVEGRVANLPEVVVVAGHGIDQRVLEQQRKPLLEGRFRLEFLVDGLLQLAQVEQGFVDVENQQLGAVGGNSHGG
ncbi:hypothetical protein SAMN00120144_0212 [Hymenobacter roseosalivarius DSM 11622]|uniref:Uncharacterized protein n=1 Tax=Hymenobacter roseosalivarius DSM 11622 TaxID=645990 RepID=A0A1W1W1U3_9BACT|nr:hypothetical protein [Hymenobacter roseosalivarius]SMB99473.1 hypothetical protein SAMN00120144_0212 [Hymenobacter roseosalivarius DSM 11622]